MVLVLASRTLRAIGLCLAVKPLGLMKTLSDIKVLHLYILADVTSSEINCSSRSHRFCRGSVWFYRRIYSTKVMSNASDDYDDLDS
jgi:hypothetical protein